MHRNGSKLAFRRSRTPIRDLDGNIQAPQGVMAEVMIQKNHSGPIPSNEQMQGYKNIDPQLPSRIMAEAEKNSEHIRNKEMFQIKEHYKDKRMARICALIAINGAFFLSAYSLLSGYPIVAGTIGVTVVLGLATIFVLNQRANLKEDKNAK